MTDQELIRGLRTESLYKDKATLEIMDLCMEAANRLTAVLGEMEQVKLEREHVGNGVYVLNHDYVEAAHRLAAYEDTGLEPEEIAKIRENVENLSLIHI